MPKESPSRDAGVARDARGARDARVARDAQPARLSELRAAAVASAIDLDVSTTGICYACLSFVSFPLDSGDQREARREARKMAPILWDEGLEEPALASLERARNAGVPDAELALQDVERDGRRSIVVFSIVLRLAADLTARTQTEMALEAAARPRLPLAPPEAN